MKTSYVADNGERMLYGEGMAVREPATGKGRYDLISPLAMKRLALRYEYGASKYDSKVEINLNDFWNEYSRTVKELAVKRWGDEAEVNFEIRNLSDDVDHDMYVVIKANGSTIREHGTVKDLDNDWEVNSEWINLAKRVFIDFPIESEIAETYEVAEYRYYKQLNGGRNWERGMPFSRYYDSAMRHLQQFLEGQDDEDHLAAAAWNIFALMHHQELHEDHLNNLPNYNKSKRRVPDGNK